jgi:hypothetical protein
MAKKIGQDLLFAKKRELKNETRTAECIIAPAMDVFEAIEKVDKTVKCTILDPWYNKGVGGVRDDYEEWLKRLVAETAGISEHIFLWGFPDIVHVILSNLPENFRLIAWLTWYYKNCPSVIKGWRSSQLTCLHIARENAELYPQNFFNEEQKERYENRNMRFVPGPPSVIEAPLLVGFVGRNEQTGHPAQKPLKVIKPLILMSTLEGDWVFDPMCGSGTTGEACLLLNRNSILCDISEEYLDMTRSRLENFRAR